MHPSFSPLSTTRLSHAAATGAVGRDLGFLPRRQTTPPAGLLLGWRRFLDSPSSHLPAPWPSAYRPAPRPAA